MMIDVDPGFRGAHEFLRGAEAILNCRVEREGNVEILRFAQGRLEEFAARQKTVFFEEAVLVSNHHFFAKLGQGKSQTELAAESVAIRSDVAEHGETFLGTQNRADFLEARLGHCFSGVSISCRISKTRAPGSMESSR